jgi:hypothetical protein
VGQVLKIALKPLLGFKPNIKVCNLGCQQKNLILIDSHGFQEFKYPVITYNNNHTSPPKKNKD